jgi:ribosomal protein L33
MANKKAGKKKKIGVYRCTETGETNYVVKVTPTTPKMITKYSAKAKKHTEHKLSEKTK